jgi:hypothetical protein
MAELGNIHPIILQQECLVLGIGETSGDSTPLPANYLIARGYKITVLERAYILLMKHHLSIPIQPILSV